MTTRPVISMPPNSISLPVTVDVSFSEVTQGIFGIEGWLDYSDERLAFTYRTKDMYARVSDQKTLELPLDGLREAVLRRWALGATLILHPRRREILDEMPGADPDKLVFKISKADRRQAVALADQLQRILSEDEMSGIPFRLPDDNFGLTEIGGVLYLEEEYLVFDVGTGLPGGSRKDHQIIKIEYAALNKLQLDRGLLKDRLHVAPKTNELLQAMPGTYKEELVLSIRKKYREAVEQLVYEVRRQKRKSASA